MVPVTRRQRIAAALLILSSRKRRGRKRKCWVRDWILQRDKFGAYNCLIQELRICDVSGYRNFLRMTETDMEELLSLIGGKITKKDTHLRTAIPAKERLAITIRFLASGKNNNF